MRTDLQLSSDPLLPLEQISVGGSRTVRGYRKNLFVRDQAVISSLEVRIPVLRIPEVQAVLSIEPFFDYGYSWNRSRPTIRRKSIASPGIGARLTIGRWAEAELHWGYALHEVPVLESDVLQDHGIHFLVRLKPF
jgi:hemolysin activation/secretion protein